MFESWTQTISKAWELWLADPQWHWVTFAWGQVILAYIGYSIYLYKRSKKLK